MKKLLFITCLLIFSFSYSNAQGYSYYKNYVGTKSLLLGSLPKVNYPNEKLSIKVFGGSLLNSNLGMSTYTISIREGLKINLHREGGIHDATAYVFKVYETTATYDFVLEIARQYVIYNIESVLISTPSSGPNTIVSTEYFPIGFYDPTGKTDVTASYPVNAIFATDKVGNIGIGTENPKAKLDVRGKIIADEVEIKVNKGADFVFEPDYNLKSLSEVEAFVKKNKHLPEVPSEKQMQEEGINVNDMQIKLLQKIEELTLYLIQQEKLLLEQSEQIESLEKKNSELEKLIRQKE